MIRSRISLIFLIFGCASSLLASDAQNILSDKYDAGPFLIYDCLEKHWTCVSEENFTSCKSDREEDSLKLDVYTHSCSPIGLFPTKESCNQRKLFLTTHHHGQRFCVKEEWRSKNVTF